MRQPRVRGVGLVLLLLLNATGSLPAPSLPALPALPAAPTAPDAPAPAPDVAAALPALPAPALPPLDLPLALPLLLPPPIDWNGSASPAAPPPPAPAAPGRGAREPSAAAGTSGRDDASVATLSAVGPSIERAPTTAALALAATALVGVLGRLFSRFRRENVLDHPSRARIHAALAERPGATLEDLAAATGLRRGALVHHCHMLERHGLLRSRHDGLRRRYHLAGARAVPVERPPTGAERRVLDALRERGPMTQAQLAALLGVTVQAVSYHLLRLQADGRVEALPGAPASCYRFKGDDRSRLSVAAAPGP